MLRAQTCFGLAVLPLASMQSPETQYQPPWPDMQVGQGLDMQYQQMPDMQMMHQTPPVMGMPEMPVMQEMPEMPGMAAAAPKRDDGSEACQAQQAANPLHAGMSVLEEGRTYCSQAADSRWWDVVVKSRNCDGSYSVTVKDDVGTEWPVAQRAYFLDKPCNDFYREVLLEEGLSEEEIRVTLQQQGFKAEDSTACDHNPTENVEVQQETPSAPAPPPPEDGQGASEPKQSRWSVGRKMPMKVVAAAAAAGAVPLVYGLSGS